MVTEFQFPPELVEAISDIPEICAALLQMKKEGFEISERGPLLIVAPNINDAHSILYFQGGNYTIPPGAPGYVVPPATFQSLAAFITQQYGVTERTNGAGYVYFVDNLANLTLISEHLRFSSQFSRVGAASAARFGVPVEPPYVTFLLLASMNGPPQAYASFNVI